MKNIENYIFHNLQIGVNWCVEWQVIGAYSRKHSWCKKLIYHNFTGNIWQKNECSERMFGV